MAGDQLRLDVDEDGDNDSNQAKTAAEICRDAVFDVLHEMGQDTNISFTILLVFWLFQLLALLMLPFGPSETLPWESSATMRGMWAFLGQIWFAPGAGEHLSAVSFKWVALFGVLAGWSASVLACACWLALAAAGYSDYRPKWMTLYLRVSARVAIHAFWFPLVVNLASPFNCPISKGSTWYNTGLTCWAGPHVTMVVVTAILLPLVFAWHLIVTLTFVNREPDYNKKKNLLAAPHGRVDAAMLILRTFLALLYVFSEENSSSWGFLLPQGAAGLLWAYLFLTYMPYNSTTLNKIQVSFSFVFISAVVCALLATGLGDGASAGQTGAIAWLLMLPLTIFSGWSVASMHIKQYATGKAMQSHELELMSPFAVELRARVMLAEAIATGRDPRSLASSRQPDDYYGGQGQGSGSPLVPIAQETHSVHFALKTKAGPVPLAAARRPSMSGASVTAAGTGSTSKPTLGVIGKSQSSRRQSFNRAAHASDEEDATRLLGAQSVRDDVSSLWQDASRSFGQSPMLHLFWAQFHASINLNFHLEQLKMKDAVDRADWSQIDVHFFAWSRGKTLAQQADAAGATKMNVERRTRFERLTAQSRLAVASAREQVLSFWAELSQKHPDLVKLQHLGISINATMGMADSIFRELLELASRNASVVRTYADFLLELANDPRKAQELLADAEQIEEDASKDHAAASAKEMLFASAVGNFDLSADTVGMLRVASDKDHLGTITHANPAACRLFGYSRRELIGSNLNDLVPEPIGSNHHTIMMRFLNSGETRFLGVSRVTFILHRAGYIVPIKVHVQPSGSDFRAVLDNVTIPSGEMYVWCMGENSGWRVTALCEASMMTLGVDAATLQSGGVSLASMFEYPGTVMQDSLANGQAVSELVVSRADARSTGAKGKDARPDVMPVSVKAQSIFIPAVGQPIYMLRIRRSVAMGFVGNPASHMGGMAPWTAKLQSEDEDEDARSNSAAGSDVVQGDSGSEGGGAESRPVGRLARAGSGRMITISTRPSPAGPAKQAKLPHGHPGLPADADELDITMCPVMSSKPAVAASAGTGAAGPAMATNKMPGSGPSSRRNSGHPASRVTIRAIPESPSEQSPVVLPGSVPAAAEGHHSNPEVDVSLAAVTGVTPPSRGTDPGGMVSRADTSDGLLVGNMPPGEPMEGSHELGSGSAGAAAGLGSGAAGHALSDEGSQGSANPVSTSDPAASGSTAKKKKAFRMKIPTDHEDSGDEGDDHGSSSSRSPETEHGQQGNEPPANAKPELAPRPASGADKATPTRMGMPARKVAPLPVAVAVEAVPQPVPVSRPSGPAKQGHEAHGPKPALKPASRRPSLVEGAMAALAGPLSPLGHGENASVHSGMQGKNQAGSVHSKGSGASATSITDIVRKGVMSKSGQLESSLRMVRWAVLLSFLLTAALNIASYFVTEKLMNQMRTNLDLVYKNGLRSVLAQRLYSNVMGYRAAAINLAAPVNMTAASIRNEVYLQQYEALNQELYLAVDGTLPEEVDLYTNGSALTVKDFRNGTKGMPSFDDYIYTTRTVNLANGAIELATRMRRILALNASDVVFVEPAGNVFFVIANGPGSLRTGMNSSLMLADKRSATQGDQIKLADTVVLIVAESLFFLVIIGAMLPAIVKVARSRQAVFDVFIQVPLPIIQALRSSVQKRIQAIQQAEEEADVGIDIAGQGNELEDDDKDEKDLQALLKQSRSALRTVSGRTPTSKGNTGGKGAWAEDHDGADSGPDLSAAVNASANTGMASLSLGLRRRSKRRSFKNSGSANVRMMLAFTWPILLYMMYFAVMWYEKGIVVDDAAMSRAELLWSVQAEVYARMANIRIRFALTFIDPVYVTQELDLAEHNLAFTEVLVDGILYGSAVRNMRPGLQANGAEFRHVWLENACTNNDDWFYTMADCETFYTGVMTKGLMGVFRTYAELGRKLIQSRRDDLLQPPVLKLQIEPPGTDTEAMAFLGNKYLAEAFARVSRMQRDAAVGDLQNFQTTYGSVVGITVAALAVFWLLVYGPMISKLDKDIKNVRLLLLLFPDEVARSVPAIVAAGKELLAEAGSSGGSVASHSVIQRV